MPLFTIDQRHEYSGSSLALFVRYARLRNLGLCTAKADDITGSETGTPNGIFLEGERQRPRGGVVARLQRRPT